MPDGKGATKFLIFGDLGNGHAKTLSMLQDEIYKHQHNLIFHVGDFAYNLGKSKAEKPTLDE